MSGTLALMTALPALVTAAPAPPGLNAGGLIMMVLAVGGSTGLLLWCVWRIVREPDAPRRLHSQLDIEPRDRVE